jgi:paraquat-inducible protein B
VLNVSAESLAVHLRHRISLVWIIPLVAALAAGWLGWRTLASRGPIITIVFSGAEGLEAGKTKIEHNNIVLGLIESLKPADDLAHVIATARMSRFAEGHLTEGSRFWIVRPRFSIEGISGLSTLISGAYVELDPGQGAATDHFTALDEPPVVSASEPGRTFSLHATRLGSIAQNDPVYYRGLKVGEVLGDSLSDADGSVTVRIFVGAPHAQLVREGTRFWNASGLSVSAGSEGFKIHSESLLALLVGGIDFDVPLGAQPGEIAKSDAQFTLYDDVAAASDAIYTRTVRFLLHFPDAVDNLVPGAQVRMHGLRVGQVADVHMEYDAETGRISVPVVIAIEPERVKILHAAPAPGTFEQRAYATIAQFVAQGLRARLGSGNLLTGQKVVNLDFVPDAPAHSVIEGGEYPEIPTVPSSNLDTVIESAKDLLGNLQATVTKLNGIISSPAVTRSIRSLDASLANLDHITHDLRIGVGPLITALRATAGSADAALKQAQGTLATAQGALDSRRSDGGDLAGTLRELKNTAQSVRVLADYLDLHPGALLLGRSEAAGE